jgi:hypothetical protein
MRVLQSCVGRLLQHCLPALLLQQHSCGAAGAFLLPEVCVVLAWSAAWVCACVAFLHHMNHDLRGGLCWLCWPSVLRDKWQGRGSPGFSESHLVWVNRVVALMQLLRMPSSAQQLAVGNVSWRMWPALYVHRPLDVSAWMGLCVGLWAGVGCWVCVLVCGWVLGAVLVPLQ